MIKIIKKIVEWLDKKGYLEVWKDITLDWTIEKVAFREFVREQKQNPLVYVFIIIAFFFLLYLYLVLDFRFFIIVTLNIFFYAFIVFVWLYSSMRLRDSVRTCLKESTKEELDEVAEYIQWSSEIQLHELAEMIRKFDEEENKRKNILYEERVKFWQKLKEKPKKIIKYIVSWYGGKK